MWQITLHSEVVVLNEKSLKLFDHFRPKINSHLSSVNGGELFCFGLLEAYGSLIILR